jgi:hypothetical protein
MEHPHPTTPTPAVILRTAPLPGDAKVLVFVAANAHVTHVVSLSAQAARDFVLELLDAIDIAAPDGDGNGSAWRERG